MVLSEGQTTQIKGSNQEPKKQTHTNMPSWFFDEVQKQFNGRKWDFQQIILEQLDIHRQKNNKSWPNSYNLCEN